MFFYCHTALPGATHWSSCSLGENVTRCALNRNSCMFLFDQGADHTTERSDRFDKRDKLSGQTALTCNVKPSGPDRF